MNIRSPVKFSQANSRTTEATFPLYHILRESLKANIVLNFNIEKKFKVEEKNSA